MNITEQEESARQTKLEIELDDTDIEPYLNRSYQRVVQRVNIPGFRKGKAPLNIVKKKYENNVLSEVIEKIVEQNTKKLIVS